MVAVEAGGEMYDVGTRTDESTVIASTKTRPKVGLGVSLRKQTHRTTALQLLSMMSHTERRC